LQVALNIIKPNQTKPNVPTNIMIEWQPNKLHHVYGVFISMNIRIDKIIIRLVGTLGLVWFGFMMFNATCNNIPFQII
jgi:hypothetical protein